jgi:hypothetical protein
METFLCHSPGFRSRISYTLRIQDYEDKDLMRILHTQMMTFGASKLRVEEGVDGRFLRTAIRRLGRGRGRDEFGNARAV